jgi:hypothetical protein
MLAHFSPHVLMRCSFRVGFSEESVARIGQKLPSCPLTGQAVNPRSQYLYRHMHILFRPRRRGQVHTLQCDSSLQGIMDREPNRSVTLA